MCNNLLACVVLLHTVRSELYGAITVCARISTYGEGYAHGDTRGTLQF